MQDTSYLGNAEPALIDELYRQYREKPENVDPQWQRFFEGFDFRDAHFVHSGSDEYPDEFKVINLINAYRERGHLFTQTNPVRTRRKYTPTLDIENFGLSVADLNKTFHAGVKLGLGKAASLKSIIEMLQETYCNSIGVEYRYIRNTAVGDWLRDRMESTRNKPVFSTEEKKNILAKLNEAVYFEKFIHKKFPGQKRFSLEGAETLIPALESIIVKGHQMGVHEYVIGMSHRGRLNVLANIMHKSYKNIFSEFEGKEYDDLYLLGDVKYHLGFTSDRHFEEGGHVHLTLAPNPSHLEAVDPVVTGIVKARIDLDYDGDVKKIVPVLIHGDAAIAGQGVVYEVLQMSELQGYHVGGTIHLIINNQIGFTTNYLEARSSTYCTDVAKVVQSPIFHVNGDDAEALAYTIGLAMEFRQTFHKDVFIDILCYRKYGHNEGDEPRFTQPVLYKIIEKHADPYTIYKQKLLDGKLITTEEIQKIEEELNSHLEDDLSAARKISKTSIRSFLEDTWKSIRKATDADFDNSPPTGVEEKTLLEIAGKITVKPDHLQIFRKLEKLQEDRRTMVFDEHRVDWAMGELLAYGSLLNEGIPVRLSGQDSERGTFSHRHSVLRVEDSEEKFIPLQHISEKQAPFVVLNSPLNEYGVLGFEYGYSLASPMTLTLWEAQFGDFANGAQIIFDQFISSAEEKWNVMNDLVVLLPHGYEGQGPEHSSARMERFLTLCAENNLQIANCTTPANFFHILRRQIHRDFRKPLIIFTPKSLLRHPECVSSVSELIQGRFHEIIDDSDAHPDKVHKVVLCSGKVYFDLLAEKRSRSDDQTALIRIEQLHPFPRKQFMQLVEKYQHADTYLWVQEEPANMGAWGYISQQIRNVPIRLVARPASGSPATGSPKFHQVRQKKIIQKTFEECQCERKLEECRMLCIGNDYTNYI
jgi:2-oxoglutarate dehydrogenase E1 component